MSGEGVDLMNDIMYSLFEMRPQKRLQQQKITILPPWVKNSRILQLVLKHTGPHLTKLSTRKR